MMAFLFGNFRVFKLKFYALDDGRRQTVSGEKTWQVLHYQQRGCKYHTIQPVESPPSAAQRHAIHLAISMDKARLCFVLSLCSSTYNVD
jgi:hypothetical protein